MSLNRLNMIGNSITKITNLEGLRGPMEMVIDDILFDAFEKIAKLYNNP